MMYQPWRYRNQYRGDNHSTCYTKPRGIASSNTKIYEIDTHERK